MASVRLLADKPNSDGFYIGQISSERDSRACKVHGATMSTDQAPWNLQDAIQIPVHMRSVSSSSPSPSIKGLIALITLDN